MPTHFEEELAEPSLSDPTHYQFAEFQIDIAADVLRRKGEKLILNRRAFGVLRLLVERSGQVVSKQDFFDNVWADTFVEDNSLTVAMATLRKALGDDAKNPRFIENIPRKGYRFVADVTEIYEERAANRRIVSQETAAEPPESTLENSGELRIRTWLIPSIIFASIAFLIFLSFSFWFRGTSVERPEIGSMAVLPFSNDNPEIEYLSDGLTEGLIDSLGGVTGLAVVSRNSAFRYKGGQPIDTRRASRELNVQSILTGEVVQTPGSITVNAELTDVRVGSQLWRRKYVRQSMELKLIQQEIVADVLASIRAGNVAGPDVNAQSQHANVGEAYFFYLRGRYFWNKRENDDTERAIEFYKKAIESDPAYAQPHLGLANCYLWVAFRYPVSRKERSGMVKAAARNALEIDPNLGEAYATLGIASHFLEWDWATAEANYKKAIQLAPNYATGHHWYGEFLATMGRFDESFAEYRRALELDPLSLPIRSDFGFNYFYARQPRKAIEELKKVTESDPGYLNAHEFLASAYEDAELFEDVARERSISADLLKAPPERKERLARIKEILGQSGASGYWKLLQEFDLREGNRDTWNALKCHSKLGETDQGFQQLQVFLEKEQSFLVWLKVSPELDNMRKDPRFNDIVRRIGIP